MRARYDHISLYTCINYYGGGKVFVALAFLELAV